jgi:hypothetical protein
MAADEKPGGVNIGDVGGSIQGAIIAGRDVIISDREPPEHAQPQAPDPVGADEYNIATVRKLLLAAFTTRTLPRFCQDRPTFRPILADLSPDHGLNEMVDRVIDYCETRVRTGELLLEVKNENPRMYARFESQL